MKEQCKNKTIRTFFPVLAMAFVILPVYLAADNTTYYIDSINGNDSGNGTSQGTPWKTLAKVNSVTYGPGDRIIFKAGASWTGQLLPGGSGNSGRPIVIDTYGTRGTAHY
jgi:hypothetical protein